MSEPIRQRGRLITPRSLGVLKQRHSFTAKAKLQIPELRPTVSDIALVYQFAARLSSEERGFLEVIAHRWGALAPDQCATTGIAKPTEKKTGEG